MPLPKTFRTSVTEKIDESFSVEKTKKTKKSKQKVSAKDYINRLRLMDAAPIESSTIATTASVKKELSNLRREIGGLNAQDTLYRLIKLITESTESYDKFLSKEQLHQFDELVSDRYASMVLYGERELVEQARDIAVSNQMKLGDLIAMWVVKLKD